MLVGQISDPVAGFVVKVTDTVVLTGTEIAPAAGFFAEIVKAAAPAFAAAIITNKHTNEKMNLNFMIILLTILTSVAGRPLL